MFRSLVLLSSFFIASQAACGFPNGTDTKISWWQGPGTANAKITSLSTTDSSGAPEYPIYLTKPLKIKVHLINNEAVGWNGDGFTQTIKLWQYTGFGTCNWEEVPTFGLLDNQPACKNGVPCPLPVGENDVTITMDFTGYSSIINLLKDDSPYQIDFIFNDKTSGKSFSAYAQARCRTKN